PGRAQRARAARGRCLARPARPRALRQLLAGARARAPARRRARGRPGLRPARLRARPARVRRRGLRPRARARALRPPPGDRRIGLPPARRAAVAALAARARRGEPRGARERRQPGRAGARAALALERDVAPGELNAAVVLRAASGPAVGLGHAMRCRAIAQALEQRGGRARVVLDEAASAAPLPAPGARAATEDEDPGWAPRARAAAW